MIINFTVLWNVPFQGQRVARHSTGLRSWKSDAGYNYSFLKFGQFSLIRSS